MGNTEILQGIENASIVIEPFDKRQLGPNSYDVRLGKWYYEETSNNEEIHLYENLDRLWDGPYIAEKEILIRPGTTVLAHTEEIIGGRYGVTTTMSARSTIVRSGLCVCKAGGYGDNGYINRWTMEISNFTQHDIYIPVGMRVAQIAFHQVGNYDKIYSGKYGQCEWVPEDMLPKPQLDWDKE